MRAAPISTGLLIATLMLGCPGAKGGAAAPSEGTTIDGSFACTGGGGKAWKASFTGTKIDSCTTNGKDQVLDVRIGTVEDGLTLHLTDYTGSGQYAVSGAGSKLAVVAKGGTGEATGTTVDTAAADPCKASCTVDVTPAGEDKLSIDITCPTLARVEGGACTTCTPTSPTLVKAHGIVCKKE